jgi:TolB-like protein/DNA-binding winged helix-turn-helix (wHTH) protein/Tfp pilus assembly protein PilF
MPNIVRFDCYEVDLASGQLYKRGIRVPLRDKSFALLTALLEHPGELVTRDELRRRLWHGNVFVDFDNNLNTVLGRLREALNDSAERPRFIETLPKRGYRFIGEVTARLGVQCPPRRRVIVLPFLNLTGNPAQEYFSDAMTDELITALARVAPPELAVIARTTAMHYKVVHSDAASIGRDLSVEYIVEGAVRRTQERIAINVQLIQVSDQTHVFAATYETGPCEIFSLHSRIASDLTAHMGACPIPGKTGGGMPGGKPTDNLAAYNEYIQARYVMGKTTPDGLGKAKQHLQAAIKCDPEFALAYDALAEVYWYLGYMGIMRPREAFGAGIVQALRAIELDNTRGQTHALLAQFHKTAEYNWPEVQREMAVALRLDPNSPLVRVRYAVSWLMPQGRMQEAVAEVEYALQSDPLSLLFRTWLALMLLIGNQHEQALEAAQQVLELDAAAYWAYLTIGSVYRDRGVFEKAIAAHRRAMELSGDAPHMMGWLGLTLGLSGNVSEPRALLERLCCKAAHGYVSPTSFAWIHLGLGDRDTAFEWLDRAVDECDQMLMPIKSYTFLNPIRSDPRFTGLLRKMNLES